ncbi:MAG: response regulator [Acidobacteria bacterium]|nr:response regulator [Acidobacteriota bacterium]
MSEIGMPTILLADDSITIQKIVNLTFSGESIDVVTVGNGDAAVKKIHEIRPALVLADIFMPGRNGYEVCDYIKNEPSLRATPVILLVGAFEPFDSDEAARVKADGHLTKPFEIKVLISAVNSLISAAGAQEDAAESVADLPVPQVADSPVADEAALTTFASLPDMPAASRSEWETEVPVELPFPEPVSAGVSTSVALGIDTEDAELLAPAETEPVAEAVSITGNVFNVQAETRQPEPEPSLMIEDSDPLGLPAVDGGLDTGRSREIALDARSMVVDIWEPRATMETSASASSDEPAIVPVEERSSEMETPGPAVQEVEVAPALIPESSTDEPQLEPAVSPAVSATESELPPAHPASEPTVVPSMVSEELIERIANRVVEKLSREVIERIAWEVVPDLAELMIKEHVEAQLKESHRS